MQVQIAAVATQSALMLGKWDELAKLTHVLPLDSLEGSVNRAVIALRDGGNRLLQSASEHVAHARSLLDVELSVMVSRLPCSSS